MRTAAPVVVRREERRVGWRMRSGTGETSQGINRVLFLTFDNNDDCVFLPWFLHSVFLCVHLKALYIGLEAVLLFAQLCSAAAVI